MKNKQKLLTKKDGSASLAGTAGSAPGKTPPRIARLVRVLTRREMEIARLQSLLQQMLDVAENADETGYVTDVGYVNLDKLHAEVRASLPPNN